VLDDLKPEERELSIRAGFAWRKVSHLTAFYIDLDWSRGMIAGRADIDAMNHDPNPDFIRSRPIYPYEIRQLGGEWEQK
jgi:hypothetical protein